MNGTLTSNRKISAPSKGLSPSTSKPYITESPTASKKLIKSNKKTQKTQKTIDNPVK